ncbi:class I SAM-dependent methyltransferase [Acaryochloris sp. IP29b_bin.137]|uniref:class I SAM-dependent methyltransferase n=1 Tax=Acaryochloris sp. IP29b_bin.137 TaxID=2969217 RepID=UPI0026396F87|nr:class I SAM-dependent methyltransferase [Acaryochloris sp. IP29b_bin.137]
MWNQRYAEDDYIYGTEPNSFLAEHSNFLINPILSLAEGEGRNAVFLASLGFSVYGVDGSDVGLAKAQQLAQAKGVKIQTEVADLSLFEPPANTYGSVISISAHLPSTIRNRLYPLVEQCLKPNGIILLEAYSENQMTRNTGGPKDLDMLISCAKVEREFPNYEPILLQELNREVCEGKYHTGMASVVQFIGRKKS